MISALLMLSVAAVPGTADPPAPLDPSDVLVTWFNDDWGLPNHDVDDNRTNAFQISARVWKQCRVLAEHHMLTDRDGGTRIDQAYLAWAWKDADLTAVDSFPTIGIRVDGNLGGAWAQNHWHGPNSHVNLDYEDNAVAFYFGEYLHWTWRQYDRFYPDLGASGTVDSRGDLLGDLTARAVLHFERFDCWAGLCLKARGGQDEAINRSVADFERGVWLDYGFALDRTLAFDTQWSLRKSDGVGSISFHLNF